MKKLIFQEEAVRSALMLLNNIEVKGVENAKRIVMIEQILQNPEREDENNGSKHEEI